jgi:triosephosphate isomerase (TIM)
MILINFKIYKETFGEGAEKLATICKKVMEKTGVKIIPVVSAFDVMIVRKIMGSEVFVQNVDIVEEGAKTGWISAQQAIAAGASGTLLNHSEHKIASGKIKSLLAKMPKEFKSVVCIHSLGQAEGWAKNIKTDIVAYEPSHLIGSKDKSVSSEEPKMIKKIVEIFKDKIVLVGAGIHQKSDVQTALRLGAKGVLLASSVVKSSDPEADLTELADGFSI